MPFPPPEGPAPSYPRRGILPVRFSHPLEGGIVKERTNAKPPILGSGERSLLDGIFHSEPPGDLTLLHSMSAQQQREVRSK
ncbi:hypothetical protein PsJ27TS7_45190 [Paenibacillus dendritiformis]